MANETRGHVEGGGGSGNGNGNGGGGGDGSGGGVGGGNIAGLRRYTHISMWMLNSLVHGQFSHPTDFRRTLYTHVLAVTYNLHSFGTQFSNLP